MMFRNVCVLSAVLIVLVQLSQYNAINVSPKLDFVDSGEDVLVKGRVAPKIQGVRIVVDTSQLKKSAESKSQDDDADADEDDDDSSAEPKPTRNSKKTVGVRTDITFELSDEDDDDGENRTRSHKKKSGHDVVDKLDDGDDGKDQRVPVIKGSSTGGGAMLDDSNSGDDSEPKWHVRNVPVFHGTDDQRSSGGLDGERWDNRIPPIGIWTTEPNYYLKPRDPVGFKPIVPNNPWKPCSCHPSIVPNYNWKVSALKPRSFVVPLHNFQKTHRVNDKLEYPFSGSASEEY